MRHGNRGVRVAGEEEGGQDLSQHREVASSGAERPAFPAPAVTDTGPVAVQAAMPPLSPLEIDLLRDPALD